MNVAFRIVWFGVSFVLFLFCLFFIFVKFDISNPLNIFARELEANVILVKFQMSVFKAFYSFLNAFYS